jgi:hypothetical protein
LSEPSDLRQALRTESDTFLDLLDRLRQLEGEKRELQPGTPEFVNLAEAVESLAREALATTATQEALARRSAAAAAVGQGVRTPIDEIEPVRDVRTVLGEWRDAERRLADTTPGSPEHHEATIEVDRLRAEYRRAHEAARGS